MLEVCSEVTNEKEEDGGVREVRPDLGRKGRERQELCYELSVQAERRAARLTLVVEAKGARGKPGRDGVRMSGGGPRNRGGGHPI